MGKKPEMYALYHDDDFIAIGTLNEIEIVSGIPKETLRWYKTPAYQKRTNGRQWVVIKIKEDDDDVQNA